VSDHDALLVDLDGTVYRGPEPIEHAVESLEAARGRGMTVSYVTNNASRSPAEVRDHLLELGLTLEQGDVVTSAQAAAVVLAERFPEGAAVLVLGTEALADELRAVGLRPVREAADAPVAVVQGHSPRTGWADLAEAAIALAAGAAWVACNVDPTLPSDRGLLPGNGSMVAALHSTTGRAPDVAGKPSAPLLAQAVDRVGAGRPLVVGDKLDTDIAGAHAIGADSLLVLTGVSTAAAVLAADADERPTYLAADLSVLTEGGDDLEAVRVGKDDGGWSARWDGDVAELRGAGDTVAALRALCAVVWARRDTSGSVRVRAAGDAAGAALDALGLVRG